MREALEDKLGLARDSLKPQRAVLSKLVDDVILSRSAPEAGGGDTDTEGYS